MATNPVYGTGAVPGERLPAASTTVEEIISTTNALIPTLIPIPAPAPAPHPDSTSASVQVLEPSTTTNLTPDETQPPSTITDPMPGEIQQPSTTTNPTPDETISGNEPPAYSFTPLPPSPSTPRSPSPPPPPLPPSPVISPVYTLPATRPASFPLLPTNLNIPSCTPRPHTFHQPPPPAIQSPRHSIAIDIFPDPDANHPPHEEPLPTYSRYPKHGEAHCMGEIGDPDTQSNISGSVWDGRSRRQGKSICCCGMYMRTVITGIVVLIVACVIAGGVVGWQMKANFENVPDSGPQSTPMNEGSGNVDYWNASENRETNPPGNAPVGPTPTATSLLLTGPTPAAG